MILMVAVAMVHVKKYALGFIPYYKNASVEMVKRGLAQVYCGMGAEYGDIEVELKLQEQMAKQYNRGMWNQKNYTSPADFKRMHHQRD